MNFLSGSLTDAQNELRCCYNMTALMQVTVSFLCHFKLFHLLHSTVFQYNDLRPGVST